MKMGMSMGIRQVLAIDCDTCGKWMHDHAENCPTGAREKFADHYPTYRCPNCNESSVSLNTTDNYECRKCNCRFTAGLVEAPEPDSMKPIHMFTAGMDDYVMVIPLVEKGDGKFRADELNEKLEADEKRWRERRRREDAE